MLAFMTVLAVSFDYSAHVQIVVVFVTWNLLKMSLDSEMEIKPTICC